MNKLLQDMEMTDHQAGIASTALASGGVAGFVPADFHSSVKSLHQQTVREYLLANGVAERTLAMADV
jgi:hypothetical protein